MTSARAKLQEHHLGAPVIAHLEGRGLTAHQEVRHTDAAGVTRSADLIAISGSLTVAVEMKLQHSTELLAQAVHWLDLADEVWIAIPALTSKAPATIEARRLAIEVCAWKGIGVLTVRQLEKTEEAALLRGVVPHDPIVVVVHEAERQHGRNVAELRDQLREEHRDGSHAGAGVKSGARVSKIGLMHKAIREHLQTCAGRAAPLIDVARAVGQKDWLVTKWAKAKKIRGVQLDGRDLEIVLRLVDPGQEEPILDARQLKSSPPRYIPA